MCCLLCRIKGKPNDDAPLSSTLVSRLSPRTSGPGWAVTGFVFIAGLAAPEHQHQEEEDDRQ
jgi:hypothetical protein